MNKLTERLKLLNELSSPSSAAYSDRMDCKISTLATYSFNRVGGGRELQFAEWNNVAIENMDDKSFNLIIERLKLSQVFYENTKDMSMAEFLTFMSPKYGDWK